MEKIFTNRYFWIVIGVIVALIIIHRYWSTIKQAFGNATQSQVINYQPGETVVVSSTRKKELEDAAKGVYNDIYDTPIIESRDWPSYGVLNNATDNELKYLANFYSSTLSNGSSLYKDLDNEAYIDNRSLIDGIKSRLAQMGLR